MCHTAQYSPSTTADTVCEYRSSNFLKAKALQAISSHTGPKGNVIALTKSTAVDGQLICVGNTMSTIRTEAANTAQGNATESAYHLT